jgi:hypothetical protein
MTRIYRPGWESKVYRHYPSKVRAAIADEVDRRFREKTGVSKPLDPTSSGDLELRRVWLRLRDEVVGEKVDKLVEEDRRDSVLTEIPYEMEWYHWDEGAKLLEMWFERPAAIAPKYSAPVTDIIKMDWVLQFQRAKEVFDEIVRDRIWTNDATRKRLRELLRKKPITGPTFGDLSLPVPQIDEAWVNARPVISGGAPDALTAALGAFELHVAIAGRATLARCGAVCRRGRNLRQGLV